MLTSRARSLGWSSDGLNKKGWYWRAKAAMQKLCSQVSLEPMREWPSLVWNGANPRKYELWL